MESIAYTQIPNDLLKLKMQLRHTAKKTSQSRSCWQPKASPIRQSSPRRHKRPSSAKFIGRSPRRHKLYSSDAKSRPQTAKVPLRTRSRSVARDRQIEKKNAFYLSDTLKNSSKLKNTFESSELSLSFKPFKKLKKKRYARFLC